LHLNLRITKEKKISEQAYVEDLHRGSKEAHLGKSSIPPLLNVHIRTGTDYKSIPSF
jgi:hypothetical protein